MINLFHDFLHLFFPHNCLACGTDVLNNEDELCAQCLLNLPETGFLSMYQNPIEKIFYGRLAVECAGSVYYFTKHSMLQQLINQMKYRNNQAAGLYMGMLAGKCAAASQRFNEIDVIVPLPLNKRRLYKRGYNQSLLLAKGIAATLKKPLITDAVERQMNTETQTQKSRVTRWQTMENAFAIYNFEMLKNKHVLLVDDIITTGATLESCGSEILKAPNTKLSIITLAYTV